METLLKTYVVLVIRANVKGMRINAISLPNSTTEDALSHGNSE